MEEMTQNYCGYHGMASAISFITGSGLILNPPNIIRFVTSLA